VLPFREGKPLSFNILQTRIGRKNLTPKILKDAPVVLLVYDLLELNGQDLRNTPLSERHRMLEQLASSINSPELVISETIKFSTWEELTEIRKQSRSMISEGIMLKKLDSVYETGRRKGSWWKWKIDPLTIDAVLIYAQRGHGRRANLYTDYTFAVWDEQGKLIPFTKAYSGLTDKELMQVDAFIKKNTLEKFGPVRSVTPQLVFEIAFEGINASPRHKSGIALRFPRILRWRHDKKIEEADTLVNLRKMLEQYAS
jgi:DNA ligase 1